MLSVGEVGLAQQSGSIRGVVYDKDFEAPLPAAKVVIVDTGQEATTSDQGTYVLADVAPGAYTLVFSKPGFVRQVRADVVVGAGRLTDVNASLAGEFVEMEEFIVQDALQLGEGGEAALLALRFESPALLDSISSDLMSRAGAGDAASALQLVSGATVQDGKFAVIRGLPDRYVSSQLNGVRLPSADEDTRAVELDQYPSAVIDSIQVSKTFTPDQQGDASGGAVNVRLRSIPEETTFQVQAQTGFNSQVAGRDDFLTYDGGGFDFFGGDDGDRVVQENDTHWDGAIGVAEDDAPVDYKFTLSGGGKHDFANGLRIGGFASVFYERDSAYFDDGENNQYWVENAGEGLTPTKSQQMGGDEEFLTSLFDVTQGRQTVQWGGLGTFGVETENHALSLVYLYTKTTDDIATLAEDTRGKEFFFPGHDPDDPTTPGHDDDVDAAPYLRTETLEYTERSTQSVQLSGEHTLPLPEFSLTDAFTFRAPTLDWTASMSSAELDQPDKRLFGSIWKPLREISPGVFLGGYEAFRPSANINLGNLQRIFKTIDEDSDQLSVNLKMPFEQWHGEEGYVKLGVFSDAVERVFTQDSFSNGGEGFPRPDIPDLGFDDLWSKYWPDENHPLTESIFDIDYDGDQDIFAWYSMMDLPLSSTLSLVGGARFESTDIGVEVIPATEFAQWFPPGATQPQILDPGEADVDFSENNVLPSLGLVFEPSSAWSFRLAYSQTIARQTFRELTPIVQQEFLGGPIFIGNPDLGLAKLDNYDLRVDYKPYPGGLLSASWFYKDIDDPIEFVQRPLGFVFTTPVNYPEGRISGFELEARQDLGQFFPNVQGLSLGANATLIDSTVTITDDERADFEMVDVFFSERDATNAPEHLYNLYATWDFQDTGTQLGVFYTVRGDTLVAGAGQDGGNFVPSVYAKEFGTLNLSLNQRLADGVDLRLQVKNLTNPEIEEVFRSDFTGPDVTRSTFTRGIEFVFGLNVSF